MKDINHVIIDTNIYFRDPFRSHLSFKAVERLCNSGSVKLHIPYIIELEFLTQQHSKYLEDLEKITAGINSLIRKKLPETTHTEFSQFLEFIEKNKPSILSQVDNSFLTWANSIGAERIPITETAAASAMDAYFFGKPPFSHAKKREDIPDAFIFQTISYLSTSNKFIIVISEDKKLIAACASLNNVTTFKSLSDYIETDELQKEILELDIIDNLAHITELIRQYETDTSSIEDVLRNQCGEMLMWKTINSHSIPDDNNEAIINGYYEPYDIKLSYDDLSYFGLGAFGLPFLLSITVQITYYTYKGDVYLLNDRAVSIQDHNNHYFEVEDEIEIQVSGVMKLISELAELKVISIESIGDTIEITIDSIDSASVIE